MTVGELLFALMMLGAWGYLGWFGIRAVIVLGGFTGWSILTLWVLSTAMVGSEMLTPGSVAAFLAMPVMAR
jgi:hypothetical protein